MAIIDPMGNKHGKEGNTLFRVLRGVQISQAVPLNIKPSAESKKSSIEFGLASTTAASIRNTLLSIYQWDEGTTGARLTGLVRTAISASPGKKVNERDLHDGDLSYLIGFQLNNRSPLDKILRVRPQCSGSENGELIFTLPALRFKQDLVYPKSPIAVKCDVDVTLLLLNFREEYYQIQERRGTELMPKGLQSVYWTFDPAIPQDTILLVLMSLQFYAEDSVNGRRSMNSQAMNPVEIIGAYYFKDGRASSSGERIFAEKEPLPGYLGNEMLKNSSSDGNI